MVAGGGAKSAFLAGLDARVQKAIVGSLEDASHRKMRVAMRLWVKVCLQVFEISPILGAAANNTTQTEQERMTDEWSLMRFAVLICGQVSAESAAQYVSCIKSWHLMYVRRLVGPVESSGALAKLLKGLAKMFKDTRPNNAKRPILKHHMEAWLKVERVQPKCRAGARRYSSCAAFL